MQCKENIGLSVIVPAYNIEQYIMACIESIEKQSYHFKEIVIVDDGSTDGTYAKCVELSTIYKNVLLQKQENQGVTVARKNGAKMASGSHVIFIDGDDYLEPTMFASMMKYIPDYDCVSCAVFRHYSKERVEVVRDLFDKFEENILDRMIYDFDRLILQPMTPWVVNKIFERNRAVEILENIPVDITFAEDSVFLYQYMLKCRNICFLQEPFYHYRYRANSVWHSRNEKILVNINILYLYLRDVFSGVSQSYYMIPQLQKWTVLLIMKAINQYMGFDRKFSVLQYCMDTSKLRDSRIVLYGAGHVGQSIYKQLMSENIQMVIWVDRDAEHYHSMGLNVMRPESIENLAYDKILVAVKDEDLFDRIRFELLSITKEWKEIIWVKPTELY